MQTGRSIRNSQNKPLRKTVWAEIERRRTNHYRLPCRHSSIQPEQTAGAPTTALNNASLSSPLAAKQLVPATLNALTQQ